MTTTFPAAPSARPAASPATPDTRPQLRRPHPRRPHAALGTIESARSPETGLRWLAAGLGLLIVLQFGAVTAGMDPVRGTISDLFYAPGGSWLLTLSGVLTLAGGVILARASWRAGYVGAAACLALWCAGLAIATLLPTDPPGAIALSAVAEAHRWAAAVMFAATPMAGFLAARRSATPTSLRRRSWICAAVGLAQFAFCLPSLAPATAAWPAASTLMDLRGLAERALFVVMMVALVGVAAVIGDPPRPARASAPSRGLGQRGSYPHCAAVAAPECWKP